MVSYGVVPGSNQLVAVTGLPTPQLIPATPTYQLPPVTPTAQSVHVTPTSQPITATPTSQPAPDTPTIQPVSATPTVQGTSSSGDTGFTSNSKKVRLRWDGRRPIPKEEIPSLAKASSLYGQPYWWGEEENMSHSGGLSDSELDPLRRSGRILRDLDTYKSEDEGGRKKQVRRRILQERPHSSSSLENIQKKVARPATSFTVEFEAPKRAKPTQLRGQRPVLASEWRSKPLHLSSRQSTPQSEPVSVPPGALMTAQKPPSGAKRRSLRCKTEHAEGSPLVLWVACGKLVVSPYSCLPKCIAGAKLMHPFHCQDITQFLLVQGARDQA